VIVALGQVEVLDDDGIPREIPGALIKQLVVLERGAAGLLPASPSQ
jgi:hypothetical protein